LIEFLKKITSKRLRNKLQSIKLKDIFFIYGYRLKINTIINNISKLEKVKVVFIAMDIAMWKYDGLYQLMENHPRFDPVILIAPRINQNEEGMRIDSLKMTDYFKTKEYGIIEGYDFERKVWFDLKETIKPNIVFYTQPFNNSAVEEKYSIRNLKNSLFCYIPYFFLIVSKRWAYDSLLQNVAWKVFYPSISHRKTARFFAKNKGVNVCVTGYPIADEILEVNREIVNPWKKTNLKTKRIIWAPHHSILENNSLRLSSFIETHQIFLDLAEKYNNQIQIAFKPHPILLSNLYKHPLWGKLKADTYYEKWENLTNGQLETGKYIDLMLTSDAMIHDSNSFTVEYLYTKKPVMYLTENDHSENLCDFGKLAFNQHYKGLSENEIEGFVLNVILDNKDFKFDKRQIFFNDYLLPPNNNLVAKNIFNEILQGLSLNDE